jgi:delta-aminolevulinic acid dehydratase/porphobilinogen synthase
MRIRPRRLRRSAVLREALAETQLDRRQLIQPHFVVAGEQARVNDRPTRFLRWTLYQHRVTADRVRGLCPLAPDDVGGRN